MKVQQLKDRIIELEREVARLAGALEWYAPRVPYKGAKGYKP